MGRKQDFPNQWRKYHRKENNVKYRNVHGIDGLPAKPEVKNRTNEYPRD